MNDRQFGFLAGFGWVKWLSTDGTSPYDEGVLTILGHLPGRVKGGSP